jgi:hypothetical protein
VFVCATCGHQQSYAVHHDPHSTPNRIRGGSPAR